MNKRWFLALAMLAPLATAPAGAARPAPKAALPRVPRVNFTDTRLKNGLRVLLARDASAPVISVAVVYNVGAFVEPVGHTGFAHLFEHLMFEGSANLAKGEHAKLLTDNGGTYNGGTSFDFTIYYETLPSNQLALGLFLEADRMGGLDVTQRNLDNQRAVVQEERRMRYDNVPYGTLSERLQDLAFTKSPYKHMPIGSMADLNAASLAYVRHFYRTFYAPDNAVLVVSGDFDPARAAALVSKYFARIPRGPKPTFPSLYEPPQTKERRLAYTDPLASLPAYISGYHIPNGNHPDAPALEMLGSVLTGGKSARVWKSLVEVKQVCTSVSAGGGAGRGPDLFTFRMTFAPGQKVETAEAALDAEIARVRQSGVTADEMRTARVQALLGAVQSRRDSMMRAEEIGIDAVVYGDPNRANTHLAKLNAVTAADVRRVARKYLVRSNRSVVIALPPVANVPEAAQ
ncbi:MAG TPA: pitrilysin family protein [Armatimonadota bacterium]|jgi:predicted Zn-dependent peptidase